jgi:hypothetical protein
MQFAKIESVDLGMGIRDKSEQEQGVSGQGKS